MGIAPEAIAEWQAEDVDLMLAYYKHKNEVEKEEMEKAKQGNGPTKAEPKNIRKQRIKQ